MTLNNNSLYWSLAIIRVVLVLAPQKGYVHPDEFFQSIEVFAGIDTLQLYLK